ncbi:DUF7373 family lipoprotein [Nocardia nova]|jgi:hypothetical protein|uniref:DUF7373 family lipoprotein n=1 Tax=Nocardia nova TaxID=37330 RepID=UPI0025B043E9|nr:hypothetical protein [Nocardia nova]
MGRTIRRSLVFTCAALLAALTGCGVQGTPTAAELDVRTLDVGPYPVDRHSYDATAGSKGALAEGMRMSQAVVPAVRIDPSLTVGAGGRVVADSTEATRRLLAAVSKPVLDRNKMIVAYVAAGSDKPGSLDSAAAATSVTDLVLRFPDESAARQAARELEDVDFGVAPDLNRKLALPKYPDAYIHYRPGIPTIGTFMAYKQFVISLFVERPRSEEADLLAWVQKTLDAEVPGLDHFQATAAGGLDALPVDPDGLLARAVVRDRSNRTPDADRFAVYAAPAFVHISSDETTRQRLVDDTGMDAIAVADNSSVLRVRDADAGARMIKGLISGSGEQYEPADAPETVPGAKCLTLNSSGDPQKDSRFRCYVPYRRYVEVVNANSRDDIDQRVDAAYALLANSF